MYSSHADHIFTFYLDLSYTDILVKTTDLIGWNFISLDSVSETLTKTLKTGNTFNL